MRGRQVFMESLIAHGAEYMFGNPGTTESPILDALQDYPSLRYIVALHEGVALGAASYYAQTSGRPAVVNLHVAPGLGNALGMLYNALKARAPLVVTDADARPGPGAGDGEHAVRQVVDAERRAVGNVDDSHRPGPRPAQLHGYAGSSLVRPPSPSASGR